MATERQYVGIAFRPGGRVYTYHYDHDGAPLAKGDRVTVDGRDGWQTVTVDSVTDKVPTFDTKPVRSVVGDGQAQEAKGNQAAAIGELFAGDGQA